MISLSKSGYKKFIEGSLSIADTRVGVMSGEILNADMVNTTIDARRLLAHPDSTTFSIENFTTGLVDGVTLNQKYLTLYGQVNLSGTDFTNGGTNVISPVGVVLDPADTNDFIGTILLYPQTNPITFEQLNNATVVVNYLTNGFASLYLGSHQSAGALEVPTNGPSSNNSEFTKTTHAIYPYGITQLPFFNSGRTVNLIDDMRVALLSTSKNWSAMVTESFTLSTLKNISDSTKCEYISGGYRLADLGISANYPSLTSNPTTITLIGTSFTGAVGLIYYETSASKNLDVKSDIYMENSFLLATANALFGDVDTGDYYDFNQSITFQNLEPALWIDPVGTDVGLRQGVAGIFTFNDYVGPGFTDSRLITGTNQPG